MHGLLVGTRVDPRNGQSATIEMGGRGGDSGTVFNAAWPATDGEMWQGTYFVCWILIYILYILIMMYANMYIYI